jgi:HD-like signal output (HDOD) protein
MDYSQALISKLKAEYGAGQLVLPLLPNIVVCVRQSVNNSDVNLGDVVKLIQLDPSFRNIMGMLG